MTVKNEDKLLTPAEVREIWVIILYSIGLSIIFGWKIMLYAMWWVGVTIVIASFRGLRFKK